MRLNPFHLPLPHRRSPKLVARTRNLCVMAVVLSNATLLSLAAQAQAAPAAMAMLTGAGLAVLLGTLLTLRKLDPALQRTALTGLLVGLLMAGAHGLAPRLGLAANLLISPVVLAVYREPRTLLASFGLLAADQVLLALMHADGGIAHGPLDSHLVLAGMLATLGCGLAMQARVLAAESRELFELSFLVNAMGRDGPVRLDFAAVRADTPAGARLKEASDRMSRTIHEIRSAAATVSDAAQEVTRSSGELMDRTRKTANDLRESALCLEQINVIVHESSTAARDASQMSLQALAKAGQADSQLESVIRSMDGIAGASRQITEIVSLIESIAFQTNILALNAAIEAARAGEQGRGFAVVASEVRALAGRCSDAAREIRDLISGTTDRITAGHRDAHEVGSTMRELLTSVEAVTKIFQTLSADSQEHANGIRVVAQSMQELDEATRANTTVAARSGQIAQALGQQSQRLTTSLGGFQVGSSLGDAAVSLERQLEDAATAAATPGRPGQADEAAAGSTVDFF